MGSDWVIYAGTAWVVTGLDDGSVVESRIDYSADADPRVESAVAIKPSKRPKKVKK